MSPYSLSDSQFILLWHLWKQHGPTQILLSQLPIASELFEHGFILHEPAQGVPAGYAPFNFTIKPELQAVCDQTFANPFMRPFYHVGTVFTLEFVEDIAPYKTGDYMKFGTEYQYWKSQADAQKHLDENKTPPKVPGKSKPFNPAVTKYYDLCRVVPYNFDLPENGKSLEPLSKITTIRVKAS